MSMLPQDWRQTASGALQAASPLLLAMGQGLRSGQGLGAYMPQGMAGMMALQKEKEQEAAEDKLGEAVSGFGMSPTEQALFDSMDLQGKQGYLAQVMSQRRAQQRAGAASARKAAELERWQGYLANAMQPKASSPIAMGEPTGPIEGPSGSFPGVTPVAQGGGLTISPKPPMPQGGFSFGEAAPAQPSRLEQIEAAIMSLPPDAPKPIIERLTTARDILLERQERSAPADPTALRQNVEWIMEQNPGMEFRDALAVAKGGQTVNVNNIPTPPSGYENVFEGGQVVGQRPIPGGPADFKRQQDEAKAAQEAAAAYSVERNRADMATTQADSVLKTIGEIEDILNSGGLFDLPEVGIVGDRLARWGINQEAVNVRNKLDTLGSAVAFDRLEQMRLSSPTGGALGQVTERELQLLKALFGSLNQSSDEEEFGKTLDRLKEHYTKVMTKFSAYENAAEFGLSPYDPAGLFQ